MKAENPGGMNLAFDGRKVPAGGYASLTEHRHIDQQFAKVIRHLTAGCPGGESRTRIIEFVSSQPANARVIACALGLNYKTVRRHLKRLSENGLIVAIFEGTYGANYFLSPLMENHYELFAEWHTRRAEAASIPFASTV